jgi:hypothetical protein
MDVPAPAAAGAWVDQAAVRRVADLAAKYQEAAHGFPSATVRDCLLEADAQVLRVAHRPPLLQDVHLELPTHSPLDAGPERGAAAPVVPESMVVLPRAQAVARALVPNE